MRIVIVEDHPMILQVLTAALRSVPGYVVQGYSGGRDGLEACAAGADLAIFDNRLPDMTGTDAVRLLRATPATQHLPIIMITGDGDARTRMDSIKAGATDFLEKPVNIDELRLRVRNLLALHEAQKQAERRERLLESVISASNASLAVANARDPATPLTFVSDSFARLCGRPIRQMIEGAHPLLGIDADPAPARDALAAAVAARQAGRFVLQARRPAGGDFWTEVTLHPVPDPGERAHYLVVTQRDISDMVEIREAHDRLTARMSDIARLSGAWFFELGADGCVTYISEAMALALGTRPDSVLGRHVDTLGIRFAGPDRQGQQPGDLFVPPGTALDALLLTVALSDGSQRAVQVSIAPWQDAAGAFGGYRGHAVDVTDIAEARDQADRASRAKSAFLATMSHEMRTPLTAIVGLSEMLAQDAADPAHRATLGTIRDEAAHLAGVLADVLDVATMERGALVLNTAPLDPVAVLDEAVSALTAEARQRGLAVRTEVAGPTGDPRSGDGPRLRQILRNLMSNAVKFTESGSIDIRLDLRDPGRLIATITDTGIGMSARELAVVFAPFVQADDGIARRFGGSGLGLSLARFLVHAMGGTLTLESTPGKGTCATLDLPLPLAPGAPSARLDLGGQKVLVADDNRTNRRILDSMLRRLGAEVTLAEDGDEALDHWRAGDFDLLLLDINMPRLAGTDVARSIRAGPGAGAAVPILAVTANASPEQVARYREAGFDACLGKPFTAQSLAGALGALMPGRGPSASPPGPVAVKQ